MSQPTKPTIVLVPDAFFVSSHYSRLAMHLSMAGYTVSVLDLPSSTSSSSSLTSSTSSDTSAVYQADVTTIADAIREFIDIGRQVVLVLHGYAGIPGSQAAHDLGREFTFTAEGLGDGKVVKLIYLAGLLLLEKQSLSSLDWPGEDAKGFYLPCEEDDRLIKAHEPRERLFNCVAENKAVNTATAALNFKMLDHDFIGPDKCGWRTTSTAYILCEEDRIIVPTVARAMINQVTEEGVDVRAETLKAGHAPMISMPKQTSRCIVKLIEETS